MTNGDADKSEETKGIQTESNMNQCCQVGAPKTIEITLTTKMIIKNDLWWQHGKETQCQNW